jgi:hypothetical protein
MGSTFVRFHDRGFEANDAQIEVWLLLLIDEIDKLTNPPAWLSEVRREWYIQATAGFGFGVMPGLDDVVTSIERRDVVLALSSAVLRRLRSYGAYISKNELNSLQGSTEVSCFTEDVETELFERMGNYFVKLLREELNPDETDARIFP